MNLKEITERDGQIFARFEKVVEEEKPVTRELLQSELENMNNEIAEIEKQMLELENKLSDLEMRKAPIEEFFQEKEE